jgi:hypothetical protein
VESAVATGAVVTTNLLPRQPPFPPGAISKTSKRQLRRRRCVTLQFAPPRLFIQETAYGRYPRAGRKSNPES